MPARLPDHLRRTDAQRAAEWRAARRAAGITDTRKRSGPSGRKATAFELAEFVAVDGEGFAEGELLQVTVAEHSVYTYREHFYALLSASDGSEIYAPEGRLSTKQCLDFLLDIKARNRNAVLVCFGGSYDVTQMLVHGIPRELLKEMLAQEDREHIDVTIGEHDYRLTLRPRKSFTVKRWQKGAHKYEKDKRGKWKHTPHHSATLWDVWGFFQDSFVGVMQKWIPDDAALPMIREKKAERSSFARSELKPEMLEEIRYYNQEECRALVEIMNKVRDAVDALGLTLKRWDGAGAIAGAMLALHNVKDHKQQPSPEVFEAVRRAYSGGHIEACQLGYHDGTVYHYDVNSAYPSEFAELPSLANGKWVHGTGEPPPGFTVIRTEWRFHWGNAFYPLFYREENGAIRYSCDGHGWHWFPEWDAAREFAERFGAPVFKVHEWWHFQETGDSVRPFGWVREYYARRQELVAQSKRSGKPNGEEKIIKLGLNSLYGKTAQQLGARIDDDGELHLPAYFQMEWAGYVTAGCRAKLMRAAMDNPTAVIAFATDGLFATAPLTLYCPDEKELGAWEAQTHDGITMVMPGVYWLHKAGSKPKHYSRGFDKEKMSDAEFVHHAWRKRLKSVPVELTRMIGLGTVCASAALWPLRGAFASSTRALSLTGDSGKRCPAVLSRGRPWRELVPLVPRDRNAHSDGLLVPALSAPYPVAWIDGDDDEGALSREEEREARDAELA